MSERLRLKTELQARKFRAMELATEADGKIRAIKDLLVTASITPLHEINCELIKTLAVELLQLKNEYKKISEEMAKIKKELE